MLFTMMFALGAATSGGISAIGFSDRQWQWLDLPLPPSGTLVPKMVANPSMKAETADTAGLWLPRVSGASVASTWYPSRTHARSINANQRLWNCLHVAKCHTDVKNLEWSRVKSNLWRKNHICAALRPFCLHQWLCYVASIFCPFYSRVLFLSQIERPSSVL